tara:strand:- start:7526 stop:7927 length:402 start_codon:yes stop_codon:yes gene_type:complete
MTDNKIYTAIRANLFVQRSVLGRPTGKLTLIIMSDEGVDYLYSDDSKKGIAMMVMKLKGLEEKYPDTCENWDQGFLMKLFTSPCWTKETKDEHRFVFGCCVGKKGVNIQKGKGVMEHGNWMTFFEKQDGTSAQ